MLRITLFLLVAVINAKELSVVDWQQIRAEYERQRHRIFPATTGWSALSASQQWITKFDGRGFTISPNNEPWHWGLEFDGDNATVSVSGNRIAYHWSADVEEWFVNDQRGLEHGFTLSKPQPIVLKVRGSLKGRGQGESIEFVDSANTARIRYSELRAWDADRKPVPATMHAAGDRIKITLDDRSATYPVTIDPIVQQAYVKASNTGANDFFSDSVAIDGDTVAVGATGEASNATGINGNQADNSLAKSGAVYVFVRTNGVWEQQAYLKASNPDVEDFFGNSIALSGHTLVVGALAESSAATSINGNQADNSLADAGAAYVFVRSGTTWSQQAYLKASNPGASDQFGESVAISGETIVIGAPYEASNATGINGNQLDNSAPAGAAYVFVRNGTSWSQQAYLKASNTGAGDRFGRSVSVSGNTALITAQAEDSSSRGVNGLDNDGMIDSGAAYVFVRSGSSWTQQAYLKASNADAGDWFGISGAISGDTIVLGAYLEASNGGGEGDNSASLAGAVYVFQRTGVNWVQQAYLKAPVPAECRLFGFRIAISGDTLLAHGATRNQNSGIVYVFRRTGATWILERSLQAPNFELQSPRFGESLAISGELLVLGWPLEKSNATGVNGNQSDTSLINAGAAYIFSGVASSATITSFPAGAAFSASGTGCEPGTGYVTDKTLNWTPGADCTVAFTSPQTINGTQYFFHRWEDASANAARTIRAGTTQATYHATFLLTAQPSAAPTAISATPSSVLGPTQTLRFTTGDADGAGDISRIDFMIANSPTDPNGGCRGFFDTASQAIYLFYDTAGAFLSPPLFLGRGSSVQNFNCNISGNDSALHAPTETTYSVSIGISLLGALANSSRNVYLRTRDRQNLESAWTQVATWAPDPRSILVGPATSIPLPASSVAFGWTSVPGGGIYRLEIGTSLGLGDLHTRTTDSTLLYVSGLPTDGRQIFVRLTTNSAGVWLAPRDYTYTACTGCAETGVELTSHASGFNVAGTREVFTWTTVAGATKYWLDVGTSRGLGNIHAGETPLTYREVSNLPAYGLFYLRLWTFKNNAWSAPKDYTLGACFSCSAQDRSLLAPHQGSTLNSTSVTLSWKKLAGAANTGVIAGSYRGFADLLSGSVAGNSIRIDNIPADGRLIYVGIGPEGTGNYSYYTFAACTGCTDNGMHLQTPAPGSKLMSRSATFTWTAAANATKYWLEVGSTLGVGDISGGEVAATSRTVNNLPTDARTLFVRLYPFVNGGWGPPKDYMYEACTACTSVPTATLTAPAQGSTLTASPTNFTWAAAPGATNYWLDVGTSRGIGDISAGATTGLSRLVGNLPTDGRTIHARLWTFLSGAWQTPNDYTFTACTNCAEARAQLTAPANGTSFTTRTATFEWGPGVGVTQYWLDVGTVPGQGNIFGGAMTTLAKQVTNLPANGATIYVALWSFRNGAWQSPINYTYTACNGCPAENRALLTAPAIGSTLTAGTVNFTWTSGANATQYWLDVGNSLGLGDIAARNVTTTSTSVTVPRDGRTLFIRLWTFVNGAWQTPFDYTVKACTGC